MQFNYYFVPEGAFAIEQDEDFIFSLNGISNDLVLKKSNTLILATGNVLKQGIIGYPGGKSDLRPLCASNNVINHSDKYLSHLTTCETINVVLPRILKLDAIASIYFTHKYFAKEKFGQTDQIIAEYVNMVELGRLVLNAESPIGISSLWLTYTNMAVGSDYDALQQLLNEGLVFMEQVFQIVSKSDSPWNFDAAKEVEIFKQKCKVIEDDAFIYQEEFKQSQTGIVHLYDAKRRGIKRVEVLIAKNTKSILWKYWARGDEHNSLYGEGFKLTCLFKDTPKEVFISLDPNLDFNLIGLGLYLDRLEIDKLVAKGHTIEELIQGIDGKPRNGFHRNDPWFDGRGKHNFTIAAAPKQSTLLSDEEIHQAIFAYHLWNSYGALFNTNLALVADDIALQGHKLEPDHKKSYVETDSTDPQLLESIAAYNLDLCKTQIELLLAKEIGINYNEERGTIVESICREPVDDLFLNSDRIIEWIKNAFCTSYNEPEYNTKMKHWMKMLSSHMCKGFDFFESYIYNNRKNELIEQIYPYVTPELAYILLEHCRNLPPEAFAMLFDKTEAKFEITELYYKLLSYQSTYPSSFLPTNVKSFILNKESISDDSEMIFNLIKDEKWDVDFHEEIPIYAFNGVKNYFDDLFHLLSKELKKNNNNSFEKLISDFKKTDFCEIAPLEIQDIDNQTIAKIKSAAEELKQQLFIELYGENLIRLKELKYQIIKRITEEDKDNLQENRARRDLLLKYLTKLNFNKLNSGNFKASRVIVKQIERHNYNLDDDNSAVSSEFMDHLKTFEEIDSLSMLLDRIERFIVLKEVNQIMEEDLFIIQWNNLVYSLFQIITLYINSNDITLIEEEIQKGISIINELRMIPSDQDLIGTHALREQIALFLPILLEEINLPVENLNQQIENSLNQYESITGVNGIIEKINTLPEFYQIRLNDVFSGFKRYYKERLNFLRIDIKHLIEESETGDERSLTDKYIRVSNDLINESVFFDWQELKDRVDKLEVNEENNKHKEEFYNKYFYWLLKNIEEYEDLSKKEVLYQLNSEIRFAEGRGKVLEKVIYQLPYDQSLKPEDSLSLEKLTKDFELKHIIRHKPIKLIHNSYDFLIEYFISKFHVENVRETLSRFSTKFPWYYRFFTDRKNLRNVFIGLITMMFLKGIFGFNEDVPYSQSLYDFIGSDVYNAITYIIDRFWLLIIGSSFLVPMFFFFHLFYLKFQERKLAKQEGNEKHNSFNTHNKLNFLDLIARIEGKRNHLLYIPYLIPLVIVVLQIANKDTFELITNIDGIRFFTTILLVAGLTIISVYNYVKDKNPNMSPEWLRRRTNHMLWLHLCQSFLIAIFTVDLIISYAVHPEFDYDDFGIPQVITIPFLHRFHVTLMPSFTLMATFLALFFSFFIERLFGGNKE